MLADKRYCYPLTITDSASQYLIACDALATTKERYAFTLFAIQKAARSLFQRKRTPSTPLTDTRSWPLTSRSAVDMQTAEEPEYEKNDQYQGQSAAEPGPTIPTVPVIATAAAEPQDDQDNDQDCAHLPPSLPIPDSDTTEPSLEN